MKEIHKKKGLSENIIVVLARTMIIAGVSFFSAKGIAQDTNVDWGTASDDQVMLQAIELTTPIPASNTPSIGGTFYSAQHSPISSQPWPPLPANVNNFDLWSLGGDVWIVDDLSYNYDAPPMQANQPMMAMDDSGLVPPGSDDDTNDIYFPAVVPASFDPGTNLWISDEAVSGGNFTGILSNTIPGVEYQLLSANSIVPPVQWTPDGLIVGTDGTNWTPWSLTYNSSTNFFLNALSWQVDSGTSIPDWWLLKYFGEDTNIDAYADPIGDGYTLYQDFVNGWSPLAWEQPPAPQGLTVDSFNSASGTATLSWLPSPGPVTGYTIQTPNGNVNLGDVTSYIDNESSIFASYAVEADYAGGSSAWSAQVSVGDSAPHAAIVPGPQGNLYLVASGLPSDLAAIQINRNSWDSGGLLFDEFPQSDNYIGQGNFPTDPLPNGNFQIPAADITNGICEIPSSDVTPFFPYQFEIETIRSNGVTSAQTQSGIINEFGEYGDLTPTLAQIPFIDGRVDFEDNLRFLFRAASPGNPYELNTGPFGFADATYGDSSFGWPSDHICVDFYSDGNLIEGDQNISFYPDSLEPLEDNLFYENFVFNANNVTSIEIPGTVNPTVVPNTGVIYQSSYTLAFNYGDVSNPGITNFLNVNAFIAEPVVPSSAINMDNTAYLALQSVNAAENFYDNFTENGGTNVYGLQYDSYEAAWYATNTYYEQIFYPGDEDWTAWPYPDAQDPGFQIVGYYFCRPGIDPMPENANFASTNTTPLIIVPVGGQPQWYDNAASIQLAGYAQVAITNGYPGVYGYIGQYFTNAYQIDNDGNVTTNSAGILSPYGQFFATVPGPAAIVTWPDIDTGLQGTDIVYCVSMNVDKNHDGTMDTSFTGVDTTSQGSPMEFWVNDGSDMLSDIGGYDAMVPPSPPNYTLGTITCPRDLENFARLWICGLPALPTNGDYQVTLSWNNVVSGNPAINLYASVETNGGTGYLTDTNAIVAEAIEQGAPFDNYILTQGAMPDSCYDVNGTNYTPLVTAEDGYPTPQAQPMGYEGIYTNMTGNIVNFYNPFDPVLSVWLLDQGGGKPDGYTKHLLELIPPLIPISPYYSFDGTNGWYNTPIGSGTYVVTDPQESRAMISRSTTLPVGQSGPSAAHGVIQSAVNLNTQFGFNKAFPIDHSAQWTWPIQTTLLYYYTVLSSFNIPTSQLQ